MNKTTNCKAGINGSCELAVYALGFCSGHYQAFKKSQDLDYEIQPKGRHNAVETCAVEGCTKPHRAMGRCANHYSNYRYHERKKEQA